MTLQYEHEASHVYKKLKETPRTGWVMSGVPDPETVYDHTVALLTLATRLSDQLDLSGEEFADLLHILEVHDWAEALAGDEVILDEDPDDYKDKKAIKQAKERAALEQLLDGQSYEQKVFAAWMRYEEGVDDIATLAKQLDKYQAVELALMYEEQHGIPLFEEFDTYSKKHIAHPVLIRELEMLRERHATLIRKN